MAYTRATLQTIFDRVKADMEARVSDGGAPIPPTSLLGVLTSVIAGSSYLTQGFLEWISNQIFIDTADEIGIARWGAIMGINRNAPTYATGLIAPTGTASTVVPAGTQYQSSEGGTYTTDAAFTIGTTVSVAVTATTPGEVGNTTGSVLTLVAPLADVDNDAPIVSGFSDGVDLESIEDWTARILARFQTPPASGTASDYERWAREVSGVAFAWVFPAEEYGGNGSVGVGVSGEDLTQLDAGEIATVQAYIESVRPVAAYVEVFSPAPENYNLAIAISPNNATIQAGVTAAIQELFDVDTAPGGTIYISRVISAVASVGASDFAVTSNTYDGTTHTPPTNITAAAGDVPKLGAITFSTI